MPVKGPTAINLLKRLRFIAIAVLFSDHFSPADCGRDDPPKDRDSVNMNGNSGKMSSMGWRVDVAAMLCLRPSPSRRRHGTVHHVHRVQLSVGAAHPV